MQIPEKLNTSKKLRQILALNKRKDQSPKVRPAADEHNRDYLVVPLSVPSVFP